MTDNEPAESPTGSPQRAENQRDVTPLLDVLPGVDEPDAGRHALARPVPMPPDADQGTGPEVDEPAPVTSVGEPVETPPEVGTSAPHGLTAADVPVEPFSEPVPELVHGSSSEPGTAPTGLDAVVHSESAASAHHQSGPVDPTAVAPAPLPATLPGPALRDDLDPHPPTRAGWGTRVVGALVGLVVGPVAAVALLLGQSRVLAVQTDHWDADVDVFGIALVVVSALVLAALVLLSAWTAAAPVAGGVVATAVGGWALVAPGTFADSVSISGTWRTTVEQTTVAGTSGTLLTLGLLLLAGGIAAVVARRAGVRLGTFEGRTRSR